LMQKSQSDGSMISAARYPIACRPPGLPRVRQMSLALALSTILASITPVLASPNFEGKTIRMIVGSPVGGGYDLYGRFFGRHIARFLPGASAVSLQNMPGGAGVAFANWLYTSAPRDGTVFGLAPSTLSTAPLFDPKGPIYDAQKLTWIGSLNAEVAVAVSWKTSGVTGIKDLRERELIVGSVGATDATTVHPLILNNVVGTKFKIIPGYPGTAGVTLALERGEIQGIGSWNYSSLKSTRPQWLKDKSVNILLQLGLTRSPDLPDVPGVLDLAGNDEAKAILKLVFGPLEMGRPVLAPPGVDDATTAALRKAFISLIKDPQALSDAGKLSIDLSQPMDGEAVQSLVRDFYSYDPQLIAKVSRMMNAGR
jgi:tripartite-type tricarboxylate transporter receptor subunit TctC